MDDIVIKKEEQVRKKRPGKTRKYIVLSAAFLAVFIFGAGVFYFGGDYIKGVLNKGGSQGEMPKEAKDVIAQVGKILVLPEGEDPTVATVTNLEKLKDQPFFAKAKLGDRVLIYTGAKKAILYDPIANKIVEVAPLGIEQQ